MRIATDSATQRVVENATYITYEIDLGVLSLGYAGVVCVMYSLKIHNIQSVMGE